MCAQLSFEASNTSIKIVLIGKKMMNKSIRAYEIKEESMTRKQDFIRQVKGALCKVKIPKTQLSS